MSNISGATKIGIGIALGTFLGLVAGFLCAIISVEEKEELLREKERQARYRSAEYAERARDAISEARERAKAKLEEA